MPKPTKGKRLGGSASHEDQISITIKTEAAILEFRFSTKNPISKLLEIV